VSLARRLTIVARTPELIGVFGGTFDPVHRGHFVTIVAVWERLGLDSVRVIPAAIPPHRDPARASGQHRLAMLRLTFESTPGFVVDDVELRREGPSYTIDTLLELRRQRGSDHLCLVLGVDAFLQLPEWHRWREILDQSHIAVMQRAGSGLPDVPEPWWRPFETNDPDSLRKAQSGRVIQVNVPSVPVSSTSVRKGILQGRHTSDSLAEPVWNYIRKHELYGYQDEKRRA
jgi:nicotinate-nucleotide adenylyltransferase